MKSCPLQLLGQISSLTLDQSFVQTAPKIRSHGSPKGAQNSRIFRAKFEFASQNRNENVSRIFRKIRFHSHKYEDLPLYITDGYHPIVCPNIDHHWFPNTLSISSLTLSRREYVAPLTCSPFAQVPMLARIVPICRPWHY